MAGAGLEQLDRLAGVLGLAVFAGQARLVVEGVALAGGPGHVELHDALRLSTLYVTHDRDDAVALGDRVVQMRAGRVIDVAIDQSKGTRA